MNLFTAGDSFTYGEELEDRTSAWPQQLANQINYQLINLASPAASNDKILRTTFEHLLTHTPDLVVIGWSNIGRSEYADEFGYYDVWPGYQGNLFRRDNTLWREELVEYISRYHNIESINRKFLQQVILLQKYLESCKIQYVMLNIVQNEYYKLKKFPGQELYEQQVNRDTFLGFDDSGMIEWVEGCKKGPGGHFLEDGHQIVADRIYEHIRHLGWLS
jgi:lysophospholipase L1-like esterase